MRRAMILMLALAATLLLSMPVLAQAPAPDPGQPPAAATTAPTALAVPAPSPVEVVPSDPSQAVPAAPAVPAPPPAVEPSPVPAAQAPSWGAQLLSGVLGYAIQGLGLLVLGLFSWLLVVVQKKFGIELGTAKDSALRCAVRRAIGYVEELSAQKVKAGQPAPDKLAWATDVLMKRFPAVLPADLQRMIHEELGLMDGYGASEAPGAAVPPGATT